MSYRSKYLPLVVLLSGMLLLSVGFNLIYISRIYSLDKISHNSNSPVSENELHNMMKEIKRLSNQTYTHQQFDAKTREPINSNPSLIISGGNSRLQVK